MPQLLLIRLFCCLAFAAVVLTGCQPPAGPGWQASVGLQSENPSDRIAAAVDAGNRKVTSMVPLLVDRLEDPEPDVRFAAIGALQRITGQDLGYRFFAPPAERSAAVARWRQWLKDPKATSRPTSAPAKEPRIE